MYKTIETVQRIKNLARQKKIKTTKMLIDCELNVNTLSSMRVRGSWVQANTLAKIADYLDCSVDYLLGRTDNPNSHKN
ncbi:MAG: helix-turn-helix transcriptional regulator [Oscillospiraceae bacterium]|nr:helix-turn-helix transcriptional regulator [Oscillospiraceae bacterium]